MNKNSVDITNFLKKFPNSLNSEESKSRFDHIWRTDHELLCKGVIFPKKTEEVSEILKFCYENNQEVVVHGGLTNLVGGTKVNPDQLVISLEKMDRINDIDNETRTICVEAGAILENVIDEVEKFNLFLPLNFGAKGSAQAGGIVSTNAGGLRVFRYGMTRNWVVGLEAVFPDGSIYSNLKTIIKDNAGIDLKHLFIGSEGVLGVVTKIVFRLVEMKNTRLTAILSINSFENVLKSLRFLDKNIGDSLTGFELMWKNTFDVMVGDDSPYKSPFNSVSKYVVFIEVLNNENYDSEYNRVLDVLVEMLNINFIDDSVIIDSQTEQSNFWKIREDVSILETKAPYNQHFDISIPQSKVQIFLDEIFSDLEKNREIINVFPFGHIADGNIHLIIGKATDSLDLTDEINTIVYGSLSSFNGSISGEHGVGVDKKHYLHYTRNSNEIELMKNIKSLIDKKNILNPSRIFN